MEHADVGVPEDAQLHNDHDLAEMTHTSWQCLDYDQVEPQYCPFCHSDELEWEEGSFGVFQSDATCKHCGAELRFDELLEYEGPAAKAAQ